MSSYIGEVDCFDENEEETSVAVHVNLEYKNVVIGDTHQDFFTLHKDQLDYFCKLINQSKEILDVLEK